MFRLDKSTFEYMKDLSHPEIQSSSDIESIELKRQIIKTSILTMLIATFVVGAIIILFIFYLPGLFTVTQEVVVFYLYSLLDYWKILLIAFLILLVLVYLSHRQSS